MLPEVLHPNGRHPANPENRSGIRKRNFRYQSVCDEMGRRALRKGTPLSRRLPPAKSWNLARSPETAFSLPRYATKLSRGGPSGKDTLPLWNATWEILDIGQRSENSSLVAKMSNQMSRVALRAGHTPFMGRHLGNPGNWPEVRKSYFRYQNV